VRVVGGRCQWRRSPGHHVGHFCPEGDSCSLRRIPPRTAAPVHHGSPIPRTPRRRRSARLQGFRHLSALLRFRAGSAGACLWESPANGRCEGCEECADWRCGDASVMRGRPRSPGRRTRGRRAKSPRRRGRDVRAAPCRPFSARSAMAGRLLHLLKHGGHSDRTPMHGETARR